MRAIRVHRAGGPEVMALEEVPTPQPGPGEVRISARAIGLMYVDLLARAGRIPVPPPFTPGFELVGVVDAVGPEVRGLTVGTRVAGALLAPGAYAEQVVVPAAQVTALPEPLGDVEALALLFQGPTALLALRLGGRLQAGESVFLPAAVGGVGSLAVQLAKRLGAKVIAGASSAEKRRLALELGADAAVDYTRDGWADEVKAATGGKGADVVLEMLGGKTGDESLRALAPGGRLVVFGADNVLNPTGLTAEQVVGLLRKGQSFAGFSVTNAPESAQRAAREELVSATAGGTLRVIAGERFPLADAAGAHRAMEARRTTGKVVLVP